MDKDARLRQEVNRLQLELNGLSSQLSANQIQPPALSSPFPTLTPLTPNAPPSAVNLVRDGEFYHSVDTWFNPPPGSPTADVGKEAAFWWTNNPPVIGQLLDFTTAQTDPNNNTLKTPDHSNYNPEYCDWDRSNGIARLTGDKTLDALLPNNRLIVPNRAIAYFGALIALRDSTIVVPEAFRVFAAIWNNTDAPPDLPDYAKGTDPFRVDSLVRGTPASTTERRYKILALTDRGYSYLSEEETVVNAPSDAAFSTSDVLLSWVSIPGILQYRVYRHDITAGMFRLLSEIGSGANTYVDNGAVLNDDVGGYPTGTSDTPQAYVATLSNALDNLPIDGGPWVNLFLNIPIPSDYDTELNEGDQVLRVGMTKALDRRMSEVSSTNGSPAIASLALEFSTLDTGRTAALLDGDGNVLHGPEIITFVDANHVDFATNVDVTAPSAGAASTGSLLFTAPASPADGDTLTINGALFTFRNSPSGPYDIQRDVSRPTQAANTAAALNASIDPDVSLATYTPAGTNVLITYDIPGVIGDAFTLAKSGAKPILSGATLSGGADVINEAFLYIEGGGDHGLLMDAVHLSYVSGSAFAPNADDLNRLENGGQNPITAPRSSSQGGAGGGGGTGGGQGGIGENGCIALDCPVNVLVGNVIETLTWNAIHLGEVLFSGDLRPNQVVRKPRTRTLSLQIVRVKVNCLYDVEIPCSPAHPLITDFLDPRGRSVKDLRAGDCVLVSISGHVQRKPIREIIDTGLAADVGTFSLSPGHIYSAGSVRYRSPLHRILARLWRKPVVGCLSHNVKPFESV